MKADCQPFASLLPDYRWLNPVERQPLDQHLAVCPHCREELRQVRAVGEWLTRSRATAPAGFADGVMAALTRRAAPARAGRLAVGILLGALAAELALAAGLRASPAALWDKAAALGRALWSQWGAPALAGWGDWWRAAPGLPGLLSWEFVAGGLVLVVVFGWFTLQHGRTEHA